MANADDNQPLTAREIERKKIVAAEVERIQGTISTKDDLVYLLLRLHLLSEHILERIIACRLPRADRLLDKNLLSYYQKLHLVHSFDIVPDGAVQAFLQLNALRNRCSHERAGRIAQVDVDRIGRSLGAEYQEVVRLFRDKPEELLSATFVKAYAKFLAKAVAGERAASGEP